MRNILFRGKNAQGDWIYGDLIHVGDFVSIKPFDSDVEILVDKMSVGQFIGEIDKNEKKNI